MFEITCHVLILTISSYKGVRWVQMLLLLNFCIIFFNGSAIVKDVLLPFLSTCEFVDGRYVFVCITVSSSATNINISHYM